MQETHVRSLGWEDPWRGKWQATPVFLPGEPQGQKTGRLQYTGSQKSWTRLSDKKTTTSSGSYKNPELGQPNKGSSEYKQK